jgi:hypothetical protein
MTPGTDSGRGSPWLYLAPFLLLLAPFVSYLQYQRHGFTNPEVLVSALLMAAVAVLVGLASSLSPLFRVAALAGLLTFLVDIQARELGLKRLGLLFLGLSLVLWVVRRHASRLVTVMMVTVLVSLLLFPVRFDSGAEAASPGRAADPPRKDLPLVVHLLLDEFIGAEGLPRELAPARFKEEMRSFFVERVFRQFGKAYSEYGTTSWSVPQLMNLVPGERIPGLVGPGPTAGTFRLMRNSYFERLAGLGYSIRVHQPDYLYFCPEGFTAACHTYPTRSLQVLNELDVPLTAKLSVVAGTFLVQSEMYTRTKDRYRQMRRRLSGKVELPAWTWDMGIPVSASSTQIFDAVAGDLSKARRGDFVFAHFLMPHYPYVYDASCRQRPVNQWLERRDLDRADLVGGLINVPEGRADRYDAYLQQVACAQRRIDKLVQAIPEPVRRDAIVIVQGDHGSRITLVDPGTNVGTPPAPSDFVDSFSTIFAVRAEGIEPGYDLQTSSIACLLRGLVEGRFRSMDATVSCSSARTVFLMAEGDLPQPRPLPDFGSDVPPERVAVATAGESDEVASSAKDR